MRTGASASVPASSSPVNFDGRFTLSTQEHLIDFTLTNKAALVAGASRGIGRATARADAYVFVQYGHAAAEAESLVTEICAAGGQADAVQVDLAAADDPSDEI